MRYYRLEIGGDTPATYTSWVNGATDPGALQIEFDVPSVPFATPMGFAMVRVWGISLQTISQAKDFNGAPLKLYAGMQKGLPLANPAQNGLILSGTIFQAFGNWIGVNMTLDLIVQADGGSTLGNPKNIFLSWKKGDLLATAVANTLANGFPGYASDIKISDKLVLSSDEHGFFQTIEQFAAWLKSNSAAIIGGDYPGVDIVVKENLFSVYDGSTQKIPIKIAFTDLIGQPTWIDSPMIQFNCVLRADLSVGDYITLPNTLTTTTAASQSQARDKTAFQGSFQISLVRHVGSFRQPDAMSWITTFNAAPIPTGAT